MLCRNSSIPGYDVPVFCNRSGIKFPESCTGTAFCGASDNVAARKKEIVDEISYSI